MTPAEFDRRWQEIPERVRRAAERDLTLAAVLRAAVELPEWNLLACLESAVVGLETSKAEQVQGWARHLVSCRSFGGAA